MNYAQFKPEIEKTKPALPKNRITEATVARIAGTIFSRAPAGGVALAVSYARAIVAEVERTEP